MSHLHDIMDPALLDDMVDAGYIRRFNHPNGDLIGFNYAEKAQRDRVWNDATRNCRGLLVDTSGRIIARPFPKFFNLGDDPEEDKRREGQSFSLYEKVDGSLGIHYVWGRRHAVATRGSFDSEQAQWATEEIQAHPPQDIGDATHLFEIVYPANRIVVDYGGRSELVHLATIDRRSALRRYYFVPLSKRARGFEPPPSAVNVRDAWAHLDDGNFEGFVAEYADGYRVKIKLAEYVRLHRVKATLSDRMLWEVLAANTPLAKIVESIPGEFIDWAKDVLHDLNYRYSYMAIDAERELAALVERHGDDRRGFAAEATKSPNRSVIFAMLDGKDYSRIIWKALRPENPTYPVGPSGGGR